MIANRVPRVCEGVHDRGCLFVDLIADRKARCNDVMGFQRSIYIAYNFHAFLRRGARTQDLGQIIKRDRDLLRLQGKSQKDETKRPNMAQHESALEGVCARVTSARASRLAATVAARGHRLERDADMRFAIRLASFHR